MEKSNPKENKAQQPKLNLKLPKIDIASILANFLSRSKPVIGLDIGSSYIKILQLQKSGKNYAVKNCITRALPQAAKDNAAEKRKLVQEFVKEFVTESRIKSSLGRIAIGGKGIFIFSLSVPNISKKDLKGAVGIELKKRLPFQLDINNVAFDFFVTGQTKEEKGMSLQITCVAADRLVVDEAVQLVKDMNITPSVINTIPDALGNLVPFCFESVPKKTVVILDIGANITLLNFYKNRSLVFSREIPIGGEHFTHAMAKNIPSPSGNVNISIEEAEKLKRNCGIPLEDEARIEFLTDYGPLRGEQISTMMRPTMERLVMEINRTVSYYIKTFRSENIQEISLTGGGSRLRNLDKFFLFNLEGIQKVEHLHILKSVKGWADQGVFKQELVMEQAAPHLAVAFGLCLGSGGRVNLLPAKEKIEQKAVIVSTALRIVFPLVFLSTLIYYGLTYATALKYKVFINNVLAEINRIGYSEKLVKDYLSMKSKLDQRKDLLEKAKGKQPYWAGVFKEISNIAPKDVVLKKIMVVSEKEPKEIRLFGKIYAKYTFVDLALNQFVMVLEESPFFSGVTVVTSEKDLYSAIPTADFELSARLDY